MHEDKRLKTTETRKLIQVYSLKATCALKILDQIDAGNTSWELFDELDEGLVSYVKLCYLAETYIDNELEKAGIKSDLSPELTKLVRQAKALLHELIDLENKHLKALFASFNDLFSCFLINNIHHYHITNNCNIEHLLRTINLVFNLTLNQTKAHISMPNPSEFCLDDNKFNYEADMFEIDAFMYNVLNRNLISIVELMLELSLYKRPSLLRLFGTACRTNSSATLLRLLNKELNITKVEFEGRLQPTNDDMFLESINSPLDVVAYIIELIEDFQLDLNAIINKVYRGGKTLLMNAVTNERLDIVELLISKGANVSWADNRREKALFYAKQRHSKALKSSRFYLENGRFEEYVNKLLKTYRIIEVLQEAAKKKK